MPYTVVMRENQTGETRLCLLDDIDWGEHSVYWWTDGNFGCDCNRRWEFQRAGGEAEDAASPCGHGAYTAVEAILLDGTRVPLDQPF
ncbi:hypothetical protein [Nitrospirillum bahiense]|uniref:Uncharacterized protein n=1 Tax=Nitrospirillum amazonense TaxID=28077 RepID=A0A560F1T4_9PROT|nr:hypothetical protein [Nitrospirillum amazonense]TWB15579.1 hypothetical protein FBZ88_12932 [Nitrospirillum amazonense]